MTQNRIATSGVSSALVLLSAVLCGCSQVHARSGSAAMAPGFAGDRASMRVAHNVADPNSPFALRDAAPHLTARAPLLDVDGVPDCDPRQLNLYESRAEVSGAHHALRLTLANTGEACRIGGFPAISLVGSDGSVLASVRVDKVSDHRLAASLASPLVPAAARPGESGGRGESSGTVSPLVLLSPQGEAAFELGWTSGPNCLQASRIAVSAPGSREIIMLSRSLIVCEDRVQITAVAAAGTE